MSKYTQHKMFGLNGKVSIVNIVDYEPFNSLNLNPTVKDNIDNGLMKNLQWCYPKGYTKGNLSDTPEMIYEKYRHGITLYKIRWFSGFSYLKWSWQTIKDICDTCTDEKISTITPIARLKITKLHDKA